MTQEFVETVTITVGGKQFTNSGAAMWQGKNGRMRGILYDYPYEHSVGTCDAGKKVTCRYGKTYRSNFGDRRQIVYFEWDNTLFWGYRQLDSSDLVRCYEMKRTYEGTIYSNWEEETLRYYFNLLYTLPVEMAHSGKHKGHECITERFYQWRKGTPRVEIEERFMQWLKKR